ncbi:hypothetical protein J3F84DRAFT_303863 [Trichoderma pleuroticola]
MTQFVFFSSSFYFAVSATSNNKYLSIQRKADPSCTGNAALSSRERKKYFIRCTDAGQTDASPRCLRTDRNATPVLQILHTVSPCSMRIDQHTTLPYRFKYGYFKLCSSAVTHVDTNLACPTRYRPRHRTRLIGK